MKKRHESSTKKSYQMTERQTDGQNDRRTDRMTDGRTEWQKERQLAESVYHEWWKNQLTTEQNGRPTNKNLLYRSSIFQLNWNGSKIKANRNPKESYSKSVSPLRPAKIIKSSRHVSAYAFHPLVLWPIHFPRNDKTFLQRRWFNVQSFFFPTTPITFPLHAFTLTLCSLLSLLNLSL